MPVCGTCRTHPSPGDTLGRRRLRHDCLFPGSDFAISNYPSVPRFGPFTRNAAGNKISGRRASAVEQVIDSQQVARDIVLHGDGH